MRQPPHLAGQGGTTTMPQTPPRESSRLLLRLANLVAFAGTVTVNALAVALPLGGRTTGELSDSYPNLFVPAGLTFSIWGVIYLLLGIYAVYQLVGRRRFVDRIGWLFVLSSVANMAWIVAWQYMHVAVSMLVMIALLASLIAIYVRLFIGRSTGSAGEKWLVHVCFSVYLGWITVATVANATALLVHLGWSRFGLGEPFWAVVMVVVATLVTLLMLLRRGDIFHALVILWAFLGIVLKRSSAGGAGSQEIVTAAAVCMGAIAVVGALRARKYLRY
jgi:hypothetical protein